VFRNFLLTPRRGGAVPIILENVFYVKRFFFLLTKNLFALSQGQILQGRNFSGHAPPRSNRTHPSALSLSRFSFDVTFRPRKTAGIHHESSRFNYDVAQVFIYGDARTNLR
jgi:hypothetical protein